MTSDNTVSAEMLTFATDAPEVVGCMAQNIAASTIMRVANQMDEDDPFGEWLFNNSESIAGSVLRGLGINPKARAVASTPSVDGEMLEALKHLADKADRLHGLCSLSGAAGRAQGELFMARKHAEYILDRAESAAS